MRWDDWAWDDQARGIIGCHREEIGHMIPMSWGLIFVLTRGLLWFDVNIILPGVGDHSITL